LGEERKKEKQSPSLASFHVPVLCGIQVVHNGVCKRERPPEIQTNDVVPTVLKGDIEEIKRDLVETTAGRAAAQYSLSNFGSRIRGSLKTEGIRGRSRGGRYQIRSYYYWS